MTASSSTPKSLRIGSGPGPGPGLPQIWARFLVAIVGLVLAFAAALFSTVSRESGSVWGTIVLASAALLLATFVGLTTVPYLARRVVAARLRDLPAGATLGANLILRQIGIVDSHCRAIPR